MTTDKNEIHNLCALYKIINYTINPDGTVDVFDYVDLDNGNLTELPFQFGKVYSDFVCRNNGLTSLMGAPKEVTGTFICSHNDLENLVGGPEIVGLSYHCNHNILTSLLGAPKEIPSIFGCSSNNLTTLEHGPDKVGFIYKCEYNELTSLEHGPVSVNGDFRCQHNKITTLEYHPMEINGSFYLTDNPIVVPHKSFFKLGSYLVLFNTLVNMKLITHKVGIGIKIPKFTSDEDIYHLYEIGYDWEDIISLDKDMNQMSRTYTIAKIIEP